MGFRLSSPNMLSLTRTVLVTHSTESEKRYYCLGKVDEGILTMRFTYREDRIRIFGAGYW